MKSPRVVKGVVLLACALGLGACAGDDGVADVDGGGDAAADAPGEGGALKCGAGGSCALAHAESQCVDGLCQVVSCSAGWGDCNHDAADGCEIDLGTDVAHCSTCDHACSEPAHASAVCREGTCGMVCQAGFGNCDGDGGNGCEANLGNDPGNCGSCTATCGASPHATPGCDEGKCVAACKIGYADCDHDVVTGCEVDVMADALNCSACGKTCDEGDACFGGTCRAGLRVLFYGPIGSEERDYLPEGTMVTVADEEMWRGMSKSAFAAYDLIVIGDEKSSPTASMYDAAYDTRATWSGAVTGRVFVTTLDPSFHATSLTSSVASGARTFLKTALVWAASGSGTGLYASGDWNERGLDYLGGLGGWVEGADLYVDDVHVTMSHAAVAGSTDESLSSWGSSGHASITAFPESFTSLAIKKDEPGHHVIVIRD